jgi:hypothetical protein
MVGDAFARHHGGLEQSTHHVSFERFHGLTLTIERRTRK